MKSLAMMVSNGSTNNLIQVMTVLMAAVHSEMKIRVLFRDASLYRITREGIQARAWSPEYAGQDSAIEDRLKKLEDMVEVCAKNLLLLEQKLNLNSEAGLELTKGFKVMANRLEEIELHTLPLGKRNG